VGKRIANAHSSPRIEHVWEAYVMPRVLPRVVDTFGAEADEMAEWRAR
jgi:hypothetical protein